MVFCFISYVYIYPQGKRRLPLGKIIVLVAERSYHFEHWLHVSKNIALPSDFMHIFHDFIHVHSHWAGTDNPLGPKF